MLVFEYQEQKQWPPLAWLATWNRQDGTFTVRHGSRVETNENWFGEIVWNGDYGTVDFDNSDVVYGSACKQTDQGIVFVSSSSTLDRLTYLERDDKFWVSNSLPCLMEATDAIVDPFYANYYEDFGSIIRGIDDYQQTLSTSAGAIHLVYYRNLTYSSNRLTPVEKPQFARQRSTFAEYEAFLRSELKSIVGNMSDARRKHNWELLGTASTGFDSTAASVLGRDAGLQIVIAMDSSRQGESDSGTAVAKHLGLHAEIVQRDGWRKKTLAEIPFLAADAKGEDVYFASASQLLENRVLLTGFCGSMWGGMCEEYIRLVRSDQSGLSLAEYRLWAGFINVPVPTIGMYQATDLLKLAESSDAQKWSSGREYDKPFCRSVLTNAGVPPSAYGKEKKAASVLIHDRRSFLSDSSLVDFRQHFQSLLESNLPKRVQIGAHMTASRSLRFLTRCLLRIAWGLGSALHSRFLKRLSNSVRLQEYAHGNPEFRYLFPWAIEHAKSRYRVARPVGESN